MFNLKSHLGNLVKCVRTGLPSLRLAVAPRMKKLGPRLVRASMAGLLVAIIGMVWLDGSSPVSAQEADTTAPTISSVVITSDTGDDGVYGIGDKIEVTVTFSEDITVVGSPQLELTVGSSAKNAAYKSATDSKVVFSSTVAVGDSDTDGISIAANKLSLNEGTIKDAAENDADLSHSAVSDQSGHKVDGVRPTITSVYFIGSSSGQDDVHTIDEYFPAGVRFSEHVYVRGYPGPQLRLNFEGTTKTADLGGAFPECNEPICVYGFGGRYGISVQFEYMIARGDLDLDGVAINANSVVLNGGSIRDGAGNDAVLTHSAVAENSNYIVDGIPATVRSVAITSDPGSDNAYGVGDTIEVTVTFSESVRVPRRYGSNGISMPLLELNVGGVAKIARTHERSTITGTTLVFSYTVQDGDNDADGISIGANKLTTQSNYGITDNYSGCCPGGEKADLRHSAVADDGEHKVGSSMPASPSTDATLKGLTLSGIDFGTFDSTTASYTTTVANSVTQTTVTPTVNDPGANYVIRLGGATDADGTIPLSVRSNVITVEVTAEDDSTTKTYTVTVTRAAATISEPDLVVPFVYTVSNPWVYSPYFTLGVNVENQGSGSSGSTTLRYYRSTDSAITSGDAEVGTDAVDGLAASGRSMESIDLIAPSAPGTYYYGACVDAVSNESDAINNCSGSVAFTVPAETSSDATLSELTLSGINFGAFSSDTDSYTASVAYSVSQTTVTPTVNDSGATYVIKLGGVTDADGVVSLSVGSNVITVEVTAEDGETTEKYTATVTRAAPSTDATLSALILSGIDFGTFASGTASYSAQVANSVSQTTVTPTVKHSRASYVVKLGGVEDDDRVISLAEGANVITVEVTAEDGSTTKTYTVTVTRAAPSTDAILKGLTLSGIDFGTFASDTESYSATVANDVAQTLVNATLNDSRASYVTTIGGLLVPPSGLWTEVFLATGVNVITIEVTAEDGNTTQTYTVTVTRDATPSADASLKALTLSGIDFGTFDSTTASYTTTVANSVTQTTVTPTVNDPGANYVIRLGGATDADGVVTLSVGSNVITVEVTAEDDSTTRTYTVTVTRAATSISAPDLAVPFVYTFTSPFGYSPSFTLGVTVSNEGSGSSGSTTLRYYRSDDSTITSGDTEVGTDAVGSLAASGSSMESIDLTAPSAPGTYYYGACADAVSDESDATNNCSGSMAFTVPAETSTDATLSALTLSGVNFGTFDSTAISYSAQVSNSVTETTVTPTVNHSGASYVIKLGGVLIADGTVSLSVGSNVISIEVTAEDDSTTRMYTVTVTREDPPSTDATLKSLRLSGVGVGEFRAATKSYSAQVPYGVSETTVTPTVNHAGASYVIKIGGVQDPDGSVSLSVGSNVIAVEVTAEDDDTTENYTITITRASPSTDATLSAITLSGIDLGTFARGTTSYSGQVANGISLTTVTPTVNHAAASYVIKLGGVTDPDGTVPLSVGSNVITVVVTAEDDSTSQTYTVTVTRAAPPSTDATLSSLTLSGIDFGTFNSTTTSYTAQVANSVTLTTVKPTVNHSGASYVIELGGVLIADGTVSLSVGSNVISIEVTAEDDSTTRMYTVTVTREDPPSTDATLKSLRLSGVGVGEFRAATKSYSAQVPYGVSETTVIPTVNHAGASYVIKIGGVQDPDGSVSLSVGSNVIAVEVTAEDGVTTEKYTVTVTRAAPSTDATLSLLTLSSVDFGTFAPAKASYTAQVANSVSQTTVTQTVNDSEASYVIKLGGVTDTDGIVPLSVGRNVITVEVTAEDTTTTQTYTVTVTRAAPPSTDVSLRALTLSGIDFGTFDSTTISYTAQVAHSVSQTTVAPTVNHSGASYVIKLGGVTDADGTVSLSVGSNVVTVEVTAEDTTTTQTYTVTVTRAVPPSTDATLSALTMSSVDFGTFAPGTTSYTASVANSVSQTTVTPTVNDSGASYVIKLGGVRDVDGTISLSVGSNVVTVEVTAEDTRTTQTYTVTVTRADSPDPELSGDATLRSLVLSGVDFGIFDSTTVSYTTTVANSVSQTTVTPTVNHSGAGHVIKLGGVTDADGTVSLSVGSNVITVEVTAEDTTTTQTYTITVTRSAPPSTDATLSSLILSGIDLGTFASSRTTYSVQVANSVSRTTVTPTVNHSGARYVIKLGGVTDADGTVSLSAGSNVITVKVTAEDDSTSQTYTVKVTRAAPSSTDGTLSALTLSGIDFGTFDSTTISYTATVANSVSQTTVTPTVSNSGAGYVIKLGGVTDADGTVSLSVGSNVITVEVTAEDTTTTQTYTVTVTRAAAPSTDATLSSLTLSDIDFGTFASSKTSYTASIANSVSQTTVTPTVNHSGASYVIKLGGVTDADGVIALSVGSNVITVEVTAEDGETTRTYTIDVTVVATDSKQSLKSRYDANKDRVISRDEVITAIDDYLFDGLITRDEVLEIIELYLFS